MCTFLSILTLILLAVALFSVHRVRRQVRYIRTNWPGHLNSVTSQFGAIHTHLGLGLPVEPARRLLVGQIRFCIGSWLLTLALVALLFYVC